MKTLIAGNWKMNGLRAAQTEIVALVGMLPPLDVTKVDVVVCPPATLVGLAAAAVSESGVMIGGQDCHINAFGANTGDISAEMLADAGAQYVILGHSERRQDHGETNDLVRLKAVAAQRAGLIPIICVGESMADRAAGKAITTVLTQLESSLPDGAGPCVVAYEPIWAIGSGAAASPADIAEMHDAIRSSIGASVQILYGGSVKPANAGEILSLINVNGALVGGASLKANDFYGIISAA